tara:strand:+ start:12780 stop:13025 length:246 start_codon:yes stop_codon:yes gene_type:complete
MTTTYSANAQNKATGNFSVQNFAFEADAKIEMDALIKTQLYNDVQVYAISEGVDEVLLAFYSSTVTYNAAATRAIYNTSSI